MRVHAPTGDFGGIFSDNGQQKSLRMKENAHKFVNCASVIYSLYYCRSHNLVLSRTTDAAFHGIPRHRLGIPAAFCVRAVRFAPKQSCV